MNPPETVAEAFRRAAEIVREEAEDGILIEEIDVIESDTIDFAGIVEKALADKVGIEAVNAIAAAIEAALDEQIGSVNKDIEGINRELARSSNESLAQRLESEASLAEGREVYQRTA